MADARSRERQALRTVVTAAVALVALAGASRAQTAREMPAPSPADAAYSPPRVTPEYREALARLPDWNGFWQGDRVKGLGLCADCSHFYLAPDPAPAGAVGRLPTFPAGSKDTAIPYNAKYQKLYDELIEKAKRGGDTDPDNCLRPHTTPDAMATGWSGNGGVEIIMTPTEVRMTWDWLNANRRIYTDGRPHPGADDLWPTYMGHSVGRWEGDTLVVDTLGFFAGYFDQTAAPYSDKLHMTERIRMIAPDRLEDQMTFEDADALAKPFVVRRTFSRIRQPKNALLGSYCSDERDSNTAVPASLIK